MRRREREKMRDEFSETLGECEVDDIIAGNVYEARLKILDKEHLFDDVYMYTCEYIEGPMRGHSEIVYSYYAYHKIVI